MLIGLLVFQYKKKEKGAIEQEEVQEIIQEQKQEEKTDGTGENEVKEDVPESGTQKEEQSEEQPEKQKTEITNLDEYAARIMGENKDLLNERLTEWMEDYQLEVKEGTIIHVMVPASDPQSINFYIRLPDERGSLVLLTYHPRENIVTASQCSYTEEEIQAEVWEADNGPAVRDVSPQEDTGGNSEEENGSMEGESMEQEGEQTSDITGDIAEQN